MSQNEVIGKRSQHKFDMEKLLSKALLSALDFGHVQIVQRQGAFAEIRSAFILSKSPLIATCFVSFQEIRALVWFSYSTQNVVAQRLISVAATCSWIRAGTLKRVMVLVNDFCVEKLAQLIRYMLKSLKLAFRGLYTEWICML